MSYAALERHQKRLSHLEHLEAIAAWDEATMMSEGSGEARAEALATLRGIIHDESVKPAVGEWVAGAEASSGELDAWQAANLREIKRSWVRATAIPSALVEASSRAESKSEQAWRKLRSDNDWASFAPLLGDVITKKREVAQALAERLGLEPYDALLDGFEPGAKSAAISALFARLGEFLPSFIARVVEKQKGERVVRPTGPFPIDDQRGLGVELMRRLGFDFRRGRLDVSHHPFCGGVPEDVRITTRYDPADFAKAMMGTKRGTRNTSKICRPLGLASPWDARAAWACTKVRVCSWRCRFRAAASSRVSSRRCSPRHFPRARGARPLLSRRRICTPCRHACVRASSASTPTK